MLFLQFVELWISVCLLIRLQSHIYSKVLFFLFLKPKYFDQQAQQRYFNRLNEAEKHVHMFVFELFFFSNKGPDAASLLHPCAPVWWLCVWLACVSGLLRPCLLSRESASTHSLHPPAVAALWDTEARRAQIEPLLLGPAPFLQRS